MQDSETVVGEEVSESSNDCSDNCDCPCIRPCYLGQEVPINQDLIKNGLHAISLKRRPEGPVVDAGLQRRNTFPDLLRPELSCVARFDLTDLERVFHEHCGQHGSFCSHLHGSCCVRNDKSEELIRCLLSPSDRIYRVESQRVILPKLNKSEMTISGKDLDLDLEPEYRIRKSRAEFCIKTGELSMKSSDTTIRPITNNQEVQKSKGCQIKFKISKGNMIESMNISEHLS